MARLINVIDIYNDLGLIILTDMTNVINTLNRDDELRLKILKPIYSISLTSRCFM